MPETLSIATPGAALAAGVLLLLFGRKLFWLFVGVVGFLVAYRVAGAWLDGGGAGWLLAIAAGVLGALAAVFVQRLAVTLAGLAAGAVGVLWLADQLDLALGPAVLVAALIAGVAGALLVRALFALGLVVLSSLVGAALVCEGLGLAERGLVFGVLAVLGVAIQLVGRRRRDQRDE